MIIGICRDICAFKTNYFRGMSWEYKGDGDMFCILHHWCGKYSSETRGAQTWQFHWRSASLIRVYPSTGNLFSHVQVQWCLMHFNETMINPGTLASRVHSDPLTLNPNKRSPVFSISSRFIKWWNEIVLILHDFPNVGGESRTLQAKLKSKWAESSRKSSVRLSHCGDLANANSTCQTISYGYASKFRHQWTQEIDENRL